VGPTRAEDLDAAIIGAAFSTNVVLNEQVTRWRRLALLFGVSLLLAVLSVAITAGVLLNMAQDNHNCLNPGHRCYDERTTDLVDHTLDELQRRGVIGAGR
jgi:hypothetical protein